MGVHIQTIVNGDNVEFTCPEDEVLLDVLRNRLGLTGAKEGCGTSSNTSSSGQVNSTLSPFTIV